MRTNYWSCSKLANAIRGTDKPSAATGEEWRAWHDQSRKNHKIRYWIAEELLDKIQNFLHFIPDKLYAVKYYFNNRYISRTNSLTAHRSNIRPGTWCDLGNRFLPCLFDELVNFVEVELAWKNIAFDPEARKKYWVPFYAYGWFRWRTWRSAEAGLDYLKWEQGLMLDETWGIDKTDENYGKPTLQAETAVIIQELYDWYKKVYKNRTDPHDMTGWSAYCSRTRTEGDLSIFLSNNKSAEEQAEVESMLNKLSEIEQQYDDEDTAMMIKLINIRKALWT